MKYILLILSLVILTSERCKSKTADAKKPGKETDSLPACVRKLIDDAKKENPPTPPISVEQYEYKGKKGYLFMADCCDFYNTFYDENCKIICSPSGGIHGKGDMQCLDFDSLAKFVKQVWKKP